MHVADATHGRRVAEPLRDTFDRADYVALQLLLIIRLAQIGQLDSRQQRPAPRAKIFRREVGRGRSLDVIVHVARANRHGAFLFFVVIVKQFCAAEFLDVAHERGEFFIDEDAALADVMFADEVEDEATAALDRQMTIAQGRHAVSAIASDARLRADAEIEIVDEPDDDGEHALFCESVARDVFVRLPPQRAELFAEAHDLFVLEALPARGKRRMIDALHAPALVDADGLQTTVRAWRTSHSAPRGRDDQSFDSFERRFVRDAPAARVFIPEAASL